MIAVLLNQWTSVEAEPAESRAPLRRAAVTRITSAILHFVLTNSAGLASTLHASFIASFRSALYVASNATSTTTRPRRARRARRASRPAAHAGRARYRARERALPRLGSRSLAPCARTRR